MINTSWTNLNNLQLGCFGEYFAKMLFTSYGWYVYTSEVDDHGIDFVAENPSNGALYKVQVKSVRKTGTLNISKDKIEISDNNLICYLRFSDGDLPIAYIWQTSGWSDENNRSILGENNYSDNKTKSNPEWNVKYSMKNKKYFEKYKAEIFLRGNI